MDTHQEREHTHLSNAREFNRVADATRCLTIINTMPDMLSVLNSVTP